MISASPLSSAPISAALAQSGSSTITLTTTAISVPWTLASQSVSGSGSVAITTTAIAWNWTLASQSIVLAGVIDLPTAVTTWTLASQSVVPDGEAALVTSPIAVPWVLQSQSIVGGIQGIPDNWMWRRRMGGPVSFNKAIEITKSNTANFAEVDGRTCCDAIYVGVGGTVTVVFEDDSTCQYVGVAGGTLYVKAKRVNSTGTAATDMVAQYFV